MNEYIKNQHLGVIVLTLPYSVGALNAELLCPDIDGAFDEVNTSMTDAGNQKNASILKKVYQLNQPEDADGSEHL